MKVAIYAIKAGSGFGNRRAKHIAQQMVAGCRKHDLEVIECDRFDGTVSADVAIAYGWIHEPIFTAYREAGAQFAYWDLGYWDRRPKSDGMDGFHRIGVNDWDTARAMLRDCPADRFARLGIEVQERQKLGDTLLIAGMSEKAAGTHGFRFKQWERETEEHLVSMRTGFRIVVRPKPNKSAPAQPSIQEALRSVRLLVTHHSNTAVDALVAGVPYWAKKGVGSLVCSPELNEHLVANPWMHYPDDIQRFQFLYDTAYAQWKPSEMATGAAWDYIRRCLS